MSSAPAVGPGSIQAPSLLAGQLALLTKSPLFESLPPSLLAQLAERLIPLDLATGAYLLRRTNGPVGLFVVESGRLAIVVRNTKNGTTQILGALGPGQVFGASILVSGRASDMDCVALSPASLQILPADVFDAVLRQVPSFALAVSRHLAADTDIFVRHGGIPWVDLTGYTFNEQLWACMPASLASQGRLCPIDFTGDTMTIVMVDPRDVSGLDELSSAIPGVRFRVVTASMEDVRRFLGSRGTRPDRLSSNPAAVLSEAFASFRFLSDDVGPPRDVRGKTPSAPPPAVGAIEEIVGTALASGASDVHIEPERQGVTVRYRVDGMLHKRREFFPADLAKPIAIRLKTLARLDITETRKPQDGRISVQLGAGGAGRLVDLRLSTVPAKFGEKIALRLLDSGGAITDLKSLFVVDEMRTLFTRLLSRPTGFLLVTGPTGSGKSTTLYSALNARRAHHVNIMTVEDPIEYHLDGVTQVEVHPEAGTTFAAVLRALLRQDPNIILVGEMRDTETARIAVEASLTGHLVMSSLHTNGTLEAIARLRDMSIESYALANGLLAVLHQRLIQRVCAQCAAPFAYPQFVLDSLVRHGVFPNGQVPALVRGEGCSRCRNTGLHGRVMACAMLIINDELRDAISRRANLSELRAVASRGGHIELEHYAGALLRLGVTVPGEVLPLLQGSAAD